MSVLEAVESGDRVKMLRALQVRLAGAIDVASERDLPGLTLRLTAVSAELASLEPSEGGSVDDLAARRTARRSKAAAK